MINKQRRIASIFIWILLIACVAFIFSNSLKPAPESSNQSGFVMNLINTFFRPLGIELTEHFIRKTAHFTEFAIEGILMIAAFFVTFAKGKKLFFVSLAMCFTTACVDEFLQYFSPGRAPMIKDVCLDTVGAFCGILFFTLIYTICNLKQHIVE